MILDKPKIGTLPKPGAGYVEEYQGAALAALESQSDLSMPELYAATGIKRFWTEFNYACNALEMSGEIEAYFDPNGIYRMRLGKGGGSE